MLVCSLGELECLRWCGYHCSHDFDWIYGFISGFGSSFSLVFGGGLRFAMTFVGHVGRVGGDASMALVLVDGPIGIGVACKCGGMHEESRYL